MKYRFTLTRKSNGALIHEGTTDEVDPVLIAELLADGDIDSVTLGFRNGRRLRWERVS